MAGGTPLPRLALSVPCSRKAAGRWLAGRIAHAWPSWAARPQGSGPMAGWPPFLCAGLLGPTDKAGPSHDCPLSTQCEWDLACQQSPAAANRNPSPGRRQESDQNCSGQAGLGQAGGHGIPCTCTLNPTTSAGCTQNKACTYNRIAYKLNRFRVSIIPRKHGPQCLHPLYPAQD